MMAIRSQSYVQFSLWAIALFSCEMGTLERPQDVNGVWSQSDQNIEDDLDPSVDPASMGGGPAVGDELQFTNGEDPYAGEDSVFADAGAPEQGGQQGVTIVVGDAGAAAGVPPTPSCDPSATWGPAQAVPGLGGTRFSQLLSVSFDGQIWLGERLFGGGGGSPFTLAEVNGQRQQYTAPQGYDLVGGAGLGPQGLTLTLVNAAGSAMATSERISLDEPFGAPNPDAFSTINGAGLQAGLSFSDPVLMGPVLLYTSTNRGDNTFIQEALWDEDRWEPLTAISLEERGGEPGAERTPTGISVDGLTLFFWDEAAPGAFVTQRVGIELPYGPPEALLGWSGVRPNESCDTLFFIDSNGTPSTSTALN